MGAMLQISGIAERLLEAMGQLLGQLRGGLALAVVLVGSLMAATTGVTAATVTTMGLISLPAMLRSGYDKSFASGVIVASGTLGQLIPPSIVLVVLGDQLGVSVGDLFLGSLIPGLLMAGAFALYVLVASQLNPQLAPERLARTCSPVAPAQLLRVLIPPLVLIFLVLGSIFFGVATPTEAGALGAVGAMVLAAIEGGFSRSNLAKVCDETLRVTAMVMAILLGSTAFALVFRSLGGDAMIREVLVNLPGGQLGFLVVSMAVIFALGFFIDFFEIAFIVVPLLLPSARELLGPRKPALVWCVDRRQPANLLPHPTVWLCPVLSARRGPQRGEHCRDLPRRVAIHCRAGGCAGADHPVPSTGEHPAGPLAGQLRLLGNRCPSGLRGSATPKLPPSGSTSTLLAEPIARLRWIACPHCSSRSMVSGLMPCSICTRSGQSWLWMRGLNTEVAKLRPCTMRFSSTCNTVVMMRLPPAFQSRARGCHHV